MHPLRSILKRAAGRFVPRFAPPVRCVACGESRRPGRRFLSGPGIYACEICLTMVAPRLPDEDIVVQAHHCHWCGAPRLARQLRILGTTTICTACLDYARAALDESDRAPSAEAPPEG